MTVPLFFPVFSCFLLEKPIHFPGENRVVLVPALATAGGYTHREVSFAGFVGFPHSKTIN